MKFIIFRAITILTRQKRDANWDIRRDLTGKQFTMKLNGCIKSERCNLFSVDGALSAGHQNMSSWKHPEIIADGKNIVE